MTDHTFAVDADPASLEVRFEEYEGYFVSTLLGSGEAFDEVKELLWDAYIAEGGNPDVQEAP